MGRERERRQQQHLEKKNDITQYTTLRNRRGLWQRSRREQVSHSSGGWSSQRCLGGMTYKMEVDMVDLSLNLGPRRWTVERWPKRASLFHFFTTVFRFASTAQIAPHERMNAMGLKEACR
jgi:hypothetical protein